MPTAEKSILLSGNITHNIRRAQGLYGCQEPPRLAEGCVSDISGHLIISYSDTGVYVQKLILPRWIKNIGAGAFENIGIIGFVWPDECDYIPERAFFNSSIRHLENIAHIRSIGSEAFMKSWLETIDIPDGVTTIPTWCFASSDLGEVNGCRNVETILPYAFSACHLSTFAIPEKVVKVSEKCFHKCADLSSVKGLDHVQVIDNEAFSFCSSLKDISDIKKVQVIKSGAFYETAIESVDLSVGMCSCIEDWAFAMSHLKSFKEGYFLKEVSPLAFDGTPFAKGFSP